MHYLYSLGILEIQTPFLTIFHLKFNQMVKMSQELTSQSENYGTSNDKFRTEE